MSGLPFRKVAPGWRSPRAFTLIELLVVIGIAALLLTLATTSFFGATRREGVTKSRNQLRDLILLARQQACILGKTHVVVCWNVDTSATVGDKKLSGLKQGRYALFQYAGDVWKSGSGLYVPFGVQADHFTLLQRGARAISLNAPDASSFARITEVTQDSTKTDEEIEKKRQETTSITYDYYVGGEQASTKWKAPMYQVGSFSGSLQAADGSRVPLAIRVSTAFSLPQYYAFDKDRVVFVFEPDGCLSSGSGSTVSAKHSVSQNAKDAKFSISVSSDGVVKISQ